MKIQKDLLIQLLIVLVTFSVVQYFFSSRQQSDNVQAGSRVTVAPTAYAAEPKKVDIDFIDSDTSPFANKEHTVKNADLRYTFTNHGGVLRQAVYYHQTDDVYPLTFIPEIHEVNLPLSDPLYLPLLLAFDTNTPYAYTLAEKKEDDKSHTFVYRAQTPQAIVEKRFNVNKSLPVIDMVLRIVPQTAEPIQPRIILPGPAMATLRDTVAGIVYTDRTVVEKNTKNDLLGHVWVAPSLIGVENRYFINALISDENDFVRRAYYSLDAQGDTVCILEGIEVADAREWKLSFYVGPKEISALCAADDRLEQTLDYGIFAPVARTMLFALKKMRTYVPNFGWAILALTLLIRILMLPLSLKSHSSGKHMHDFSKRLKKLDERYKHDPKTLEVKRQELISQQGMGAFGCLVPLVIQIPILWGLSSALRYSIVLYKAPFAWMSDLSAPDPYYILPILSACGLLFNVLRQNKGKQQARNVYSAFLISLIMLWFTSRFPAGLLLYISVTTLVGVIEMPLMQWVKERYAQRFAKS